MEKIDTMRQQIKKVLTKTDNTFFSSKSKPKVSKNYMHILTGSTDVVVVLNED